MNAALKLSIDFLPFLPLLDSDPGCSWLTAIAVTRGMIAVTRWMGSQARNAALKLWIDFLPFLTLPDSDPGCSRLTAIAVTRWMIAVTRWMGSQARLTAVDSHMGCR